MYFQETLLRKIIMMQNSRMCYWQRIQVKQYPLSLETWHSDSAVGKSSFNEQEKTDDNIYRKTIYYATTPAG